MASSSAGCVVVFTYDPVSWHRFMSVLLYVTSVTACSFLQGKHLCATYFLLQTDPLVTLLVVFETKKVEKDSHITQFMTNLVSELRCTRQFATLRPGHK